jgi:hypothetical protein
MALLVRLKCYGKPSNRTAGLAFVDEGSPLLQEDPSQFCGDGFCPWLEAGERSSVSPRCVLDARTVPAGNSRME